MAQAIESCANRNVLIVAAAGNDGCDCLHVPAAAPSVLAVGALDLQGNPLASSNWGEIYRNQGIVAPGTEILGAAAGTSTTVRKTGTSFATPMVSGIAALLACLQIKLQQTYDLSVVRTVLLKSAIPCLPTATSDCRRFLSGSLNIKEAIELIEEGETVMTESTMLTPSASTVLPTSDTASALVSIPVAEDQRVVDLRQWPRAMRRLLRSDRLFELHRLLVIFR